MRRNTSVGVPGMALRDGLRDTRWGAPGTRRRLGEEPPRAAEGPTAASCRTLLLPWAARLGLSRHSALEQPAQRATLELRPGKLSGREDRLATTLRGSEVRVLLGRQIW